MARPTGRDLRTEVLDHCCHAIQRTGLASFSFGTIARELAVSAPTLHHHFRTKAELIEAVTERYCVDFETRRDAIVAGGPADRLEAFATLFARPESDGLVCLCAAVAGAGEEAPTGAQVTVADFFDRQIDWVWAETTRAIENGDFRPDVDAASFAEGFVAALEGALLLTRTRVGSSSVLTIGRRLIDLARSR